MRRLNIKLLVVVVGLGVLLGGAAFLAHRFQVRRTAKALLREAEDEQRRGHLDLAAAALGRYVGLKPENTEAMAWRAALLDRLAATPRAKLAAYLAYDQVLRREPSRREARRRAADLAMGLGRPADARNHLEVLIRSRPDDAEVEVLLGRAFEANGEAERAATWYEKAKAHDRHRLDAFEGLASLYRGRLDAPGRADRAMDEMVEANPRSSRAHLDRALYRRQFRIAGATEDLAKARALAPKEPDVLLEVAATASRGPEADEARRALAEGVEAHPDDPRLYQALADLELRAGRADEADARLRKGVERMPGRASLRWALADLMARRGETTGLADQLTRLRKDGHPAGPLDFLDACLRFNEGRWREARRGFERALPALADRPDLKARSNEMLARCFVRLGDVDQGIAAYRRAIAIDPSWPVPRLGLASALASQGQVDGAIAEYRALLPGSPEVRPALARLLIARNLQAPASGRRWDDVDALLKALPADSDDAAILRAEVLDAKGRRDEARSLLEQATARRPGLRIALADLVGRQGEADAALALLDDADRPLGDGVGARLERARLLAIGGKPEAAAAIERLGQGLDNVPDEGRRALLRGLAAELARLGDDARARGLWARVAEAAPDDLESRLILFDLAARAGDEAAMTRHRDEVRRIDGEGGAQARLTEARLLIWKAGRGDRPALAAARAILTPLVAQRPDWPLAALAMAEVEDRSGNAREAAKGYLRAIELGEHGPVLLGRAAQLLAADRRYDEADRVLRKLPDSSLATDDLLRLASALAVRASDPARAIELSRRAAAAHPDGYREQLWLGHVFRAAGRLPEAEAALRRATELAGAVPETWVALVQFLARSGRPDAAEAAIRRAERALPKGQGGADLARCFEAIGRDDRAEALYREEEAAHPGDPAVLRPVALFFLRTDRPSEAAARLRTILDKARDPADSSWARRTLALALIADGDRGRAREALALLTPCGDDPDDRRALARVLVAQGTRRQDREAARELEHLAGRTPLADDDRFLLARLDEAGGDWPKAREQWQALLASQPDDPSYLAEFAAGLRRHGRADEARLLVDRLEAIEPHSFRTAEIKARVLHDLRRDDEAAAALTAASRRDGAPLEAIAALLEEFGRWDAAEATYRASASRPGHPEAALDLAGFLGRRGHATEALALCDRAWTTCPPDRVAAAAVGVLAASEVDAKAAGRVARRVEEAAARMPGSATLLVSLGSLRELQGRYADAEALYRRAIERNGRDGVSLNNLAWLTALNGGDAPRALELVNRAIDAVGPEPELLDTRAVVFLALGQGPRAIADLNEANAATPSASRLFHLAQAHLKANDRKAAAEALGRARALGLVAGRLHPLERPAYERLLGALGTR